ncbi:hypothetical protein [Xenorhabdus japonica]|uniref:MobA/MobL family protein n=1 Tax=Xenorhabdus japonica TaxID=53341 RepID=A0A1I5BZQ0_9GAMM|nr:hypothetical protein [Xenorhabdus japonica]SFN80145.1 hypothetical protein SAMN05421579_12311 [Xenorhabdus japonica]
MQKARLLGFEALIYSCFHRHRLQEQPHCHLMFSDRINDAIRSDSEQYFRRHNPKKARTRWLSESLFRTDIETRKAHLIQLHEYWQNSILNVHSARNAKLKIGARDEVIKGIQNSLDKLNETLAKNYLNG